jgi:hypothetical protein
MRCRGKNPIESGASYCIESCFDLRLPAMGVLFLLLDALGMRGTFSYLPQ